MLMRWSFALDPAAPLAIALCLATPLLAALSAAAACNREVDKQRLELEAAAEEMLASAAPSDTDYVALRVKACDSRGASYICWPGGKQLGLLEPGLIIFAVALIVGAYASLGLWQEEAALASTL